jgi:hypothetical protein
MAEVEAWAAKQPFEFTLEEVREINFDLLDSEL